MSRKSSPYNFRLDCVSDKELIKMLEATHSKTEFIKNALFSYFIQISKGEVYDRELPFGWGQNIIPQQTQNISDESNEDEEYEQEDFEEVVEEEEEYYDDNADFEVG